ncbi:Phage integrase family protein [Micromonospora inositola]|uniref:Phage integrase family protein n=1 Tax=Micromonospora inositola TaxID=47865 RepID=A0A1C5K6F2_9ACTN|nr:Phage integrase family protein [Micromonospora inositola]
MPARARANGEGSIFPYRNGFAAYVWVTKPDGKRTRKYVYGKTREAVHNKWIKLHQQAKQGPVATSVPTVGSFPHPVAIGDHRAEPGTADLCDLRDDRPPLHRPRPRGQAARPAPVAGRADLDQPRGSDLPVLRPGQGRRSAQGQAALLRRRPVLPGRPVDPHGQRHPGRPAGRPHHAQTEDLITKNPAASVTLATVRRRRGQSWSSDEARRFLESARHDEETLYAAYALVLVTGLRKGEVLGLTWEDVDLDAGELTIGRQLQRVRGHLLHRDTKTQASDATLPLPDICATALQIRKAQRDEARAAAGNAWHENDLVFTTCYGTPIEPRNFQRSWQTRCEKAKVKPITVHDARRTCATLLADLDVHPRVVMQILRHARFSVTMEIYTQVSSKATLDALKRLGDSLGH